MIDGSVSEGLVNLEPSIVIFTAADLGTCIAGGAPEEADSGEIGLAPSMGLPLGSVTLMVTPAASVPG